MATTTRTIGRLSIAGHPYMEGAASASTALVFFWLSRLRKASWSVFFGGDAWTPLRRNHALDLALGPRVDFAAAEHRLLDGIGPARGLEILGRRAANVARASARASCRRGDRACAPRRPAARAARAAAARARSTARPTAGAAARAAREAAPRRPSARRRRDRRWPGARTSPSRRSRRSRGCSVRRTSRGRPRRARRATGVPSCASTTLPSPPDLAVRGRSNDLETRATDLRLDVDLRGLRLGLVALRCHATDEEEREHGEPREEDRRLRGEARPADRDLHGRLAERLEPRRAGDVAKAHERLGALRGEREREAGDASLDGSCADHDVADVRFDAALRDGTDRRRDVDDERDAVLRHLRRQLAALGGRHAERDLHAPLDLRDVHGERRLSVARERHVQRAASGRARASPSRR